jgi:colanic acid biosynthesis protein WcaH
MTLPEPFYREVVRSLPIICVDVVVRSPAGRFLLLKRRSEPLRGEWWVIGGRIFHGEHVTGAVARKLREEAGLVAPSEPRFEGYFEGIFDRGPFGDPGAYHSLSFVFTVTIPEDTPITLDAQSSEYRWAEALPVDFVVRPPAR